MDSRLLVYAILESDSAAIHFEVSGQISSLCSPPGHHSGIRNLGTVPVRGGGGGGGQGGRGQGTGEEARIHNSQFYENFKQTWVERPGGAEGQGAFGIQVPGREEVPWHSLKWDATPKTTGGAGEKKVQWVKSGCTSLWTRF